MYERFRKQKIDLALKFVEFTKKQERSQIKPRNPKVAKRERERDGNYGCDYYDANLLLWRFKMAHGTLGMLDAIVTFQDGTDLEPIDNLFSRFLALGTCTGHPRTPTVTNDSIRKRLLRRGNKKKITRWIEDINFIFSWWKTIFYSLAALVLLFSLLEKIKFISSCLRVMFLTILYISLLF